MSEALGPVNPTGIYFLCGCIALASLLLHLEKFYVVAWAFLILSLLLLFSSIGMGVI